MELFSVLVAFLVSLAAMLFLLARSGRIRIKLPSSHHDREDWEDDAFREVFSSAVSWR